MAQPRDVIEQKQGPNQILRIRSDSESNLDDLFKAVMHPKEGHVPISVPMRLRNLPASFFKQPDRGSKSAPHSRESSTDSTLSSLASPPSISTIQRQSTTELPINHPRANSSPATLQQSYSSNTLQHQHLRQHSYDVITDDIPLPPGWEMAKTQTGQRYFLNHLTQTTTWEDPRKKNATSQPSNATSPNATSPPSIQNVGPLPEGWEQATTPEGEIYFINHVDRTTSWFDPRIPIHLQRAPLIAQMSASSNQAGPGGGTLHHLPPPAHPLSGIANESNNQMSLQQRQQNLRLQRLQMERERLRMRQQEILRQAQYLPNTSQSEGSLRRSGNDEMTIPTSPPDMSTNIDPFLGGTDFHSRQESADSGLGLGPNYSLPHTPEDFLANMDDGGDSDQNQQTDLALEIALQNTNLDLENMDSEDLVPSLQEELQADLLSDMEAILNNKDNSLTWL